jgi:hypothetical protein
MYIIFGKEVADTLREKHIVLELETFNVEGEFKTAYCVIQPESLILGELSDIDRLERLHNALIDAWNRNDYTTVQETITHLHGRFAGEMDSFYDVLSVRIKEMKIDQTEVK